MVDLRLLDNDSQSVHGSLPYICRFLFPRLNDNVDKAWVTFDCRSAYSHTAPTTTGTPDPLCTFPFYPDPKQAVIPITLACSIRNQVNEEILLITSASILLSHFMGIDNLPEKYTIPWETWGPQGTRHYPGLSDYSCGSRYIEFLDSEGCDSDYRLTLADFNQPVIRRGLLHADCDKRPFKKWTLITEPNILPHTGNSIFGTEVATYLPFRTCEIPIPPVVTSDGALISDVYLTEDAVFFIASLYVSATTFTMKPNANSFN